MQESSNDSLVCLCLGKRIYLASTRKFWNVFVRQRDVQLLYRHHWIARKCTHFVYKYLYLPTRQVSMQFTSGDFIVNCTNAFSFRHENSCWCSDRWCCLIFFANVLWANKTIEFGHKHRHRHWYTIIQIVEICVERRMEMKKKMELAPQFVHHFTRIPLDWNTSIEMPELRWKWQ